MSDADDDTPHLALMVLAALVFLVVGGVIALAASRGLAGGRSAPSAATGVESALAGPADVKVYFDVGAETLPAGAMDALNQVADAARARPGATVLISGFHDATGDPAANAELAKRRAQAVRHALEADGVQRDHLILDKPAVTTGNGDDRAARRVELRLR